MQPRRSLSLSCYLVTTLAGNYWTFGWIFGGFASFFLYIFSPLHVWPLSFDSLQAIAGLIPVLFVLIGLFFLALSVREGVRSLALLRDADVTDGVLVKLLDFGERINEEPIWLGEYAFTTESGSRYICVGKIGKLTAELLENAEHLLPSQQEVLADSTEGFSWEKAREYFSPRKGRQLMPYEETTAYPEGKTPVTSRIFYLPHDPVNSVPLTGIPGNMILSPDGTTLRPGKSFLPGLIAPAVVLGGHYLVHHREIFTLLG